VEAPRTRWRQTSRALNEADGGVRRAARPVVVVADFAGSARAAAARSSAVTLLALDFPVDDYVTAVKARHLRGGEQRHGARAQGGKSSAAKARPHASRVRSRQPALLQAARPRGVEDSPRPARRRAAHPRHRRRRSPRETRAGARVFRAVDRTGLVLPPVIGQA
jgi:hypothetical protein